MFRRPFRACSRPGGQEGLLSRIPGHDGVRSVSWIILVMCQLCIDCAGKWSEGGTCPHSRLPPPRRAPPFRGPNGAFAAVPYVDPNVRRIYGSLKVRRSSLYHRNMWRRSEGTPSWDGRSRPVRRDQAHDRTPAKLDTLGTISDTTPLRRSGSSSQPEPCRNRSS